MFTSKSASFIRYVSYLTFLILIISMPHLCKAHNESLKNSKITVDVYGTNKLSVDLITKKYRPEFNKIAGIMQSVHGTVSASNSNLTNKLLTRIAYGIKSMGKFAFITISPVVYQNDKVTHFTIDIVEQKDKYRLAYFNRLPNKTLHDPDHLIATWEEYEKTGLTIFFKERKSPTYATCPAYHCLYGFDRNELKKYEVIFNKFAEKDKFKLIAILRNDKDAKKRATAAFLLAHIKNSNELINILIPSICDPSSEVRNNVMRVLGGTLEKTSNYNIPINKIVIALDFPMESDRNKAMYIILSVINKREYAKYIAHNSSKKLIEELEMQQPNLHDTAYMILKKLSGKNYSDRDYKSWELWARNQ